MITWKPGLFKVCVRHKTISPNFRQKGASVAVVGFCPPPPSYLYEWLGTRSLVDVATLAVEIFPHITYVLYCINGVCLYRVLYVWPRLSPHLPPSHPIQAYTAHTVYSHCLPSLPFPFSIFISSLFYSLSFSLFLLYLFLLSFKKTSKNATLNSSWIHLIRRFPVSPVAA